MRIMTTIDTLWFFEVLRLNVLLRVSLYSYWTSHISFLWLASFLSTFTQSVCWVLMSFRTKLLQLVRVIFYAYWLCLIPFSFYIRHCVRWYIDINHLLESRFEVFGCHCDTLPSLIVDWLKLKTFRSLFEMHACAACASTHLFLFKESCILVSSLLGRYTSITLAQAALIDSS